MTRTAQQYAMACTNDFIREYCERHEQCQATRDEAHEIVWRLEGMAADVVNLVLKYSKPEDVAGDCENILEILLIANSDEFGLAATLASSTL